MPFSASMPDSCREATGLVNAPSSGVTYVIWTRSRMPALVEVPVGEEAELERGDRALDRHVDDVDDEPAAVERRQRGCQRGRTLE